MNDTPHLAQQLMEFALDALDAARKSTLLLSRKTACEKIAAFAEMLARQSHITEATQFMGLTLYLLRKQITNELRLTLETVSRYFSALKKEGVIGFTDRYHLQVIDMPTLQEATGDDADGGLIC